MIVFPKAKINIGLNIIEKRVDGFHDLKSVFYPIPLCDVLEIIKSETFSFNYSGLEITGNLKDNLIVKAYHLLRLDYNLSSVAIHLHKVIPMGAGLGGGSSDGAYTLSLLNNLFELNLKEEQLLEYALKLGSDCPFFINDKAEYIEGRGEIFSSCKLDLKDIYIKLINPGIHISTAKAFSGIIPKPNTTELNNIKIEDLSNNDCVQNDFQKAIIEAHPTIKNSLRSLIDEGAFYSSLTGTGSTVYGLFKEEPSINEDSNAQWVFKL